MRRSRPLVAHGRFFGKNNRYEYLDCTPGFNTDIHYGDNLVYDHVTDIAFLMKCGSTPSVDDVADFVENNPEFV